MRTSDLLSLYEENAKYSATQKPEEDAKKRPNWRKAAGIGAGILGGGTLVYLAANHKNVAKHGVFPTLGKTTSKVSDFLFGPKINKPAKEPIVPKSFEHTHNVQGLPDIPKDHTITHKLKLDGVLGIPNDLYSHFANDPEYFPTFRKAGGKFTKILKTPVSSFFKQKNPNFLKTKDIKEDSIKSKFDHIHQLAKKYTPNELKSIALTVAPYARYTAGRIAGKVAQHHIEKGAQKFAKKITKKDPEGFIAGAIEPITDFTGELGGSLVRRAIQNDTIPSVLGHRRERSTKIPFKDPLSRLAVDTASDVIAHRLIHKKLPNSYEIGKNMSNSLIDQINTDDLSKSALKSASKVAIQSYGNYNKYKQDQQKTKENPVSKSSTKGRKS